MARLDDLISEVKDSNLRKELLAALSELKRRQRFGLVFEEHIPETSALYGLPVQTGSIVQQRSDLEGKGLWRVTAVDSRTNAVSIVPIEGGSRINVSSKELLVVKRFGDPMYSVLTPLKAVRRGGNKPFHAVINGENFHALQLLKYLFEKQVDCIYIDPPYNTGARDWKYNNRYVDSNDSWKHSKWLSFMEKRLKLAKKLLKVEGVLIVTVDEHEVHHLGMLLERVFPEYLRYMVTIVINPKGTGKANFSRVEEHAFFVVPDVGHDVIVQRPTFASLETFMPKEEDLDQVLSAFEAEKNESEEDLEQEDETPDDFLEKNEDGWEYRHARRRGSESSYRHQRPNQFYPIFIDEKHKKVIRAGPSIPLNTKPNFEFVQGLRPIWPIDAEDRDRVWGFVPEHMQLLIDNNRVVLGKHNAKRDSWTINYKVPQKKTRKLKTVWWAKAYDAGTHGTELVRRILGAPGLFQFPKSVYAVRDCIAAVVRDRPNALILDFFAGSGTTFHAVSLLNAQDRGNRRTILITNNEVSAKTAGQLNKAGAYRGDPEFEKHGIFEQVTLPRCEAVVTGRRPNGDPISGKHLNDKGLAKGRPFSLGFEENIEFFKLDYLDPDDVDLRRQFQAILPALWLAAGGVGERAIPSPEEDFSIPKTSNYAILFKEARFQKFKEALKKHQQIKNVWVVSDSDEAYAEIRSELPRETKTSMLYRDYLRNFQVNGS